MGCVWLADARCVIPECSRRVRGFAYYRVCVIAKHHCFFLPSFPKVVVGNLSFAVVVF